MRTLRTSDLFSFARVIKASGVRDELTELIQKIGKQDAPDAEKIGLNTMLLVIEALSDKKAEKAIYDALAPVFEMSASEVEELPPKDLFDLLQQLARENDLVNFMGSVFGTLGKN